MSQELNVQTIQNNVVLSHNGLSVGMPWDVAVEFAKAVIQLARFSQAYAKHKQHELVKVDKETVCHDEIEIFRTGLEFVFVLRGREWIRCPWTAALKIAMAVKEQGCKLEEVALHERSIEDSAMLMRTGLPVGLTHNKKIIKEAWKAAEDVEFPGMIEPTFVCYPPTILMSPPPGDNVEESR